MSASSPAVTTGVAGPGAAAATRPRLRDAGRIVIVGTALGFLGQWLFYGVGLGINLVIMVAALLLAAWRLRAAGTRIGIADVWLAPGALVLAGFVAIRADASMVAVDTLAIVALTASAMPALAGIPVLTMTAAPIARLGVRFAGWALASAGVVVADAHAAHPASLMWRRAGRAMPILRGLFIAVPLVVVFAALFASADAIFARFATDVLDVQLDLGDVPIRLLVGGAIAWLAIGALAFTVGGQPETEATGAGLTRPLGVTEALTVLVALDVLFALFVALQAAYLFGGLDTLAAVGMTYADYARRGFFELCAAAALVGGLLLAMEALIARRSRAYVVAGIALTVMTAIVLASAALRLSLYQQAYGWTELRFWVAAGIGWMGLGIVLLGAALVTNRSQWVPHGLLAGAFVVGLVMNAIGPVRFVAEQNVARAMDPSLVPADGRAGLDADYLWLLDVDAVEPLVAGLPHLHGADREMVERLLEAWRADLDREPDAWQAWNLARERARDALAELPAR